MSKVSKTARKAVRIGPAVWELMRIVQDLFPPSNAGAAKKKAVEEAMAVILEKAAEAGVEGLPSEEVAAQTVDELIEQTLEVAAAARAEQERWMRAASEIKQPAPDIQQTVNTASAKKRVRRTKAQIAADNAAALKKLNRQAEQLSDDLFEEEFLDVEFED